MSDSQQEDPVQLRQEVEYYKRQLDELAGLNLKADYTISGLRHELKQKRQGFALLSELQRSVGSQKTISGIFETAAKAINATLGMDRTVILTAAGEEGMYKPSIWMGYSGDLEKDLPQVSLRVPADVASAKSNILVHAAVASDEFIESVKKSLHLPYFVCTGVAVDDQNIGIIISGRVLEKKPLYPPLDAGDVDTFQSISGLISAVVRNMRVAMLEEADRLKTQFFANISHEFRTPITLTIGPLEAVLKGRYGALPDAIRAQAEGMLRNQVRLLTLVNQILDLTKLESGSMNLNAERIGDMNTFVADRAEQFKTWAEKRGFELKIAMDPQVTASDVYIDKEKFDRVILNLLSNSCKFTKQGFVQVSTRVDQSEFVLAVQDTGIGIKADQLPFVFDRFKQADGSASREYAGTGLGLSLVKELVELHGGKITVQSEYGKGTTFQVHIPLGKAHLDANSIIQSTADDSSLASVKLQAIDVREGKASTEELAEVAAKNQALLDNFDPNRPTLLFTDDNRDMRNFVYDILSAKYNVLLAVHGQQGYEIASQHKIDLILSDLMMPVMTGVEFCRKVRDTADLSAVPFVLLTAKTDFDSKVEGLEQGADDYLSKPFSEVELLARIKNLLRIRGQHLRLQQELRAARAIQQSLLPPRLLQFAKAELSALYVPSEELSGDFYDAILCEPWLYSYVADVTSHGTAAAQITYLIKGLFQEALSGGKTPTLPELICSIGEKYRQYKVDYSVGIQLTRLNLVTRQFELVVSSAPKGVLTQDGKATVLPIRPGPPIDDEKSPVPADYPVLERVLEPEQAIYLFTDGCYEFVCGGGERNFGLRQLCKTIEKLHSDGWDTELMDELRAIKGDAVFEDDLTMVRFRFP